MFGAYRQEPGTEGLMRSPLSEAAINQTGVNSTPCLSKDLF
jgi:hypothetical protein